VCPRLARTAADHGHYEVVRWHNASSSVSIVKTNHALADLRIDIGVQTHRPDSRDLIPLLAQPFAALVQEMLPQSFDHLDAVGTIIYRDSTNEM
jgi:hypothetical protein